MQSAAPKIWSRVAVSISYVNNHYITEFSVKKIAIAKYMWLVDGAMSSTRFFFF